MKMSWNRNASSQLCEQYITHVYVQYIYIQYIQYVYTVRLRELTIRSNYKMMWLFDCFLSVVLVSLAACTLPLQYSIWTPNSKLRTIICFKWLWFTATRQPAILSELLCILGAEGCVVDVDLRFSQAPNSKLRAIICFKWLWFTPTTQQAILSELLCILGATSSGWSSTYSTVYIWYIVHNIQYTVYSTLYSIYTVYSYTICCFSPFIQDVLLANVVTILIYCIYTVYKYSIYTVHGALARQMKMF